MSTFQFTTLEPEQLQSTVSAAVKFQIQEFLKNQAMPQEDELLTREEAAKFLKVNISTINNWRKSGKLKSYGIGNRVYFWRSEIEKSLKPLETFSENHSR